MQQSEIDELTADLTRVCRSYGCEGGILIVMRDRFAHLVQWGESRRVEAGLNGVVQVIAGAMGQHTEVIFQENN